MKTPQSKRVCYFAAIYPADEGGYWARFVDFNAADQGDTLEETLHNLTEFLQNILDNMHELRKEIPPPTDIRDFKRKLDPEDGEPVCISPVFAYPPAPAVRIQITAKANQIAAIDEYARSHSMTRSQVIIRSTLDAIQA